MYCLHFMWNCLYLDRTETLGEASPFCNFFEKLLIICQPGVSWHTQVPWVTQCQNYQLVVNRRIPPFGAHLRAHTIWATVYNSSWQSVTKFQSMPTAGKGGNGWHCLPSNPPTPAFNKIPHPSRVRGLNCALRDLSCAKEQRISFAEVW